MVTTTVTSPVMVRLDGFGRMGGVLLSNTVTVKVFWSLKFGLPLSVTITVI